MGQINKKFRSLSGGNVGHYCLGCQCMHIIYCGSPNPANGARWQFNKKFDLPTFEPSILITADFPPEDGGPEMCHYFIANGRIQYLGDCTHVYAGKTIELPEFPAGYGG